MKKDTTNDMTVGSPVSLIIKFMIPMCLGNLFQQFYNIADSIVAGKFIGVNALAAIGSTGSLMFFVTGWLNGLSSGFAIIVAQMFGAKKFDRMRHYVAMSIYLMAAFSIVMTIGFSSRRRHTRYIGDWSSDVCSSDLLTVRLQNLKPIYFLQPAKALICQIVSNRKTKARCCTHRAFFAL